MFLFSIFSRILCLAKIMRISFYVLFSSYTFIVIAFILQLLTWLLFDCGLSSPELVLELGVLTGRGSRTFKRWAFKRDIVFMHRLMPSLQSHLSYCESCLFQSTAALLFPLCCVYLFSLPLFCNIKKPHLAPV